MANLTGMDIEQVREMGRRMQADADRIRSQVVAPLDNLVHQIPGVWRGHDAERFKGWWQNEHRGHLSQVARQLHGLGQSALNNAQEQEQASGGGGRSGAGGSPSTGRAGMLPGGASAGGGTSAEFNDLMRDAAGAGGAMAKLMRLDVPGPLDAALTIGVVGSAAADYGWGDARTMDAEVDGMVGAALSKYPPAGLAWYVGHDALGKPIAAAADQASIALTGQDMGSNAYDAYVARTYGDTSSMRIDDQARIATEMSERYSGWSGFGHFTTDSIGNAGHGIASVAKSGWHKVFG